MKEKWTISKDGLHLSRAGVTIYIDNVVENPEYYVLKNNGENIGIISKSKAFVIRMRN